MSLYKVDPKGVEALNGAANQVLEACEELTNLVGLLKSVANDNPDVLGPHVTELNSAIEEIESNVNNLTTPAEEVSERFRQLATIYQDIIDKRSIGFIFWQSSIICAYADFVIRTRFDSN